MRIVMTGRVIGCKSEITHLMNKYGLTAKKKFGQNFLVEPNVINQVIGQLDEEMTVIEIGPGLGSLTCALAEKVRKVIAYEIDSELCEVLKQELAEYDNLQIINADFLKVDLDELFSSLDGRIAVVSNLPYYITSELLMKLLTNSHNLESIIAMMQKEVAERFFKKEADKDYGLLQVIAPYYSDISLVCRVNRHNFLPQPKVDSAILKFTVRDYHHPVDDPQQLEAIIRACYRQRRKKVISNLASEGYQLTEEDLKELGISESARCEQLSLDDYIRIYEVLKHD